MAVSVCPVATINAPAERVWRLLSEPANYALWWDAQTRSIVPAGPAAAGQRIYAQSAALGRQWDVKITVQKVDEAKRQLHLTTRLPLGITVYNYITTTPLDRETCRLSFG